MTNRGHRRTGILPRLAALAATLLIALGAPAAAQSLFQPVVRVNDSVITAWEVDQRTRFLTLFRTPGDVREIAIDRLVEERLQIDAARAAGLTASPEAIEAGMTEFAARANLTAEEFMTAIGQGGVSPEAFRDFVRAGILWRELVRSRFGDEARPTPDDIDRRLLETGSEGGTRVLLYEIILPGDDPATLDASRARAEELTRIADPAEFRAAARRFSRAPTRIDGGELDWLALDGLPPEVQSALARLGPGQTSRPIILGASVALFHVREREEVRAASPEDIAIDYAVLALGSPEAAERAAGRVRTCDDLYGEARGLPEDQLRRETLRRERLPSDVARALATLDPGEIATLPGAPGTLVMFCGRELDTEAALNRTAIAQELVGRKLGQRAARLLAQLRADAVITRVE